MSWPVWNWSLPAWVLRWSPFQAWEALNLVEQNGWIRLWAPEVSSQAKAAMQGFVTTTGTLCLYALAVKVPALQSLLKLLAPGQQSALPSTGGLTQGPHALGNTMGPHPALPSPTPMAALPGWGPAAHLWQHLCSPQGQYGVPPVPLCGGPLSPWAPHSSTPHAHRLRALPNHVPSSDGTALQLQMSPMPVDPAGSWMPHNHSQRQIAYYPC